MDLFKLMGRIVIDNTEANRALDDTADNAADTASAIKKANDSVSSSNKSGGSSWSQLKAKVSEYKSQGMTTSQAWRTAATDMKNSTADAEGGMIGSFKAIGAAVMTYLAVDKIIAFGKGCVETAATVQAQTAQFEAAFGDLGGEAKKTFKAVGDETGILATRLQTEGTKAFSMFKGAGMEAGTALEESETFLRLAADAAAYYDISLEEASERVLGFAKGNFENGDAIGVFTNEASRNAIAMEQYGKKYSECTEAQKQMMALDMIEHTYEMSGALGQASREADGYENVTGNLKESWKQFQAVLGAPILKAVIPVLKSMTDGMAALTEKTKAAIEWAGEHKTIMSVIGITLGTVAAAITAYNIAQNAAAIATAVTTAATTAWGAAVAFATSPVTLIVLAIGALIAAGVALYQNWDVVSAKAKEIFGAIGDFFAGVWEKVKAGFAAFGEWFKANWDTLLLFIVNPIAGVFKYLYENFEGFRNFVDGIVSAVKGFFAGLWADIQTIFQNIADWIGQRIEDVKNFFTSLWEHVVNVFETIKNAISVAIQFIGALFSAAVQIITLPFQFIWENCKQYVFAAWEWIKSHVSTAINAVKTTISNVMTAISAFFSSIWNTIKSVFSAAWSAISSTVSEYMAAIKAKVTEIWNSIKSFISSVLNSIKSAVTTAWNAVKSATQTAFNAVKSVVTNVWNAIKSAVQKTLNAIKSAVTTAWNAVKSATQTAFNAVKSVVTNVWNAIKSAIQKALDAIKSTVSKIWNSIKTTISNVTNGIKTTVSNAFNKVKESIEKPINKAKEIVKNGLDAIKGFFSGLNLKFPSIKLPHFSIKGKFSLDPPSVPKLSIEWYKKAMQNAMLLNQPTIFGYSGATGKFLGAGESGQEVVAGAGTLMNMIQAAVQTQNGGIIAVLQQLLDMLVQYFPEFAAQRVAVFDRDAAAAALAVPMNRELGKLTTRKERGR